MMHTHGWTRLTFVSQSVDVIQDGPGGRLRGRRNNSGGKDVLAGFDQLPGVCRFDHHVGHVWSRSMTAEPFPIAFFSPSTIVARFQHIAHVCYR